MHRADAPYNGQMGIPVELTLTKDGNGYTLRANPISKFNNLLKNKVSYVKPTLPLSHKMDKCAHDIRLKASGEGSLELSVFGASVKVDLDAKKIITDSAEIPLVDSNAHEIHFIFDTDSVEVFANGGAAIASSRAFADHNLVGLTASSNGSATVEALEISEIRL